MRCLRFLIFPLVRQNASSYPDKKDSMIKSLPLLLLACFLNVTPSYADVRLPKILNSHMVLQRNSEVRIWGWADPGEQIEVTADWLKSKARATTDAMGQWEVFLKTRDAGKAHALTITGTNSLHLQDILFGEVWIASIWKCHWSQSRELTPVSEIRKRKSPMLAIPKSVCFKLAISAAKNPSRMSYPE